MYKEKPYTDLNEYLRSRFGSKVYKLALDGGMTCPNRDGRCGYGGCIFCSEGGSGDFAQKLSGTDLFKLEDRELRAMIGEQLSAAREKLRQKLGNEFETTKYIAYFQSFTNTYAPVEYLEKLFRAALSDESVCALSVGTRPDCLSDEVVKLIEELNREKPVWIELGLQTIHDATARAINRGYELPVFEDALSRLNMAGIEVIVHVILGLPEETEDMMLQTVDYLAKKDIQGIKLQLLHVMKGTELGRRFLEEEDYSEKLYIKEPEQYIKLLARALELLPERIVIHRISGDAPHDKLLFPMWSANKRITLNGLLSYMKQENMWQGKQF